ncbi:uncharacterized protein LOC117642864 [Thrips palmi]|uniref:Uncharacterized protein LOC117642864 n=1 Tax=Thrips palmi TaxID=161013 RepID=A0A6P8YCG5_THRPL|nr:uncharacterized protein LOC117642864 [Thrips palmi]
MRGECLMQLTIIFHRCHPGAATEGSCEYYTTWNWTTGLCGFLAAKGLLWSRFIESVHPPFICPVRKGYYEVINGTVSMRVLDTMTKGLSIEKYTWKVGVRIHNELQELVVCGLFKAELRRVVTKRGKTSS